MRRRDATWASRSEDYLYRALPPPFLPSLLLFPINSVYKTAKPSCSGTREPLCPGFKNDEDCIGTQKRVKVRSALLLSSSHTTRLICHFVNIYRSIFSPFLQLLLPIRGHLPYITSPFPFPAAPADEFDRYQGTTIIARHPPQRWSRCPEPGAWPAACPSRVRTAPRSRRCSAATPTRPAAAPGPRAAAGLSSPAMLTTSRSESCSSATTTGWRQRYGETCSMLHIRAWSANKGDSTG